ncbi:phosphotransferase enzyme family protein [Nocardia blacklockiae]|uniref:phosphotransferase enzyme family protein n=1 Tax=Nocardia blacklockiae TaxID=480036 RepID=UPI0018952221|nr:phosphotransferase [Nocardia blacklockiae]MBF6171211.1 phosphotransferase [Nocardia blacklockiae]
MADDRVFGMGESPTAEPDWPPVELDEIGAVRAAPGRPAHDAVALDWRSPRPLSSTARVRLDDGTSVIVKRLPRALRDAAALAEEHAFAAHLRARGIPIPAVWQSFSRGEFEYEVHAVGVGADDYGDAFSWSPYRSAAHAAAAGRMLARLHLAAAEYDAPVRPPRPLQAGLCTDLVATVEDRAARWPAVRAFLDAHGWRAEVSALRRDLGAAGVRDPLRVDVSGLPALWTHNDWHGTNLLWTGDEITAVIDFGLANRTVAVFDLATAIERFAVDWLALRRGRPARVHADQLAAFLRGYRAVRPLDAAERHALPALFPLAHIDYELSELEYFLAVLPAPNHENAEIAYRDYLFGHLRWAYGPTGRDFAELLSRLCD